MSTFATVVPLHSLIRNALQQLRDARSDGDPTHNPQKCAGPCRICVTERALNRLVDRIPRKVQP